MRHKLYLSCTSIGAVLFMVNKDSAEHGSLHPAKGGPNDLPINVGVEHV